MIGKRRIERTTSPAAPRPDAEPRWYAGIGPAGLAIAAFAAGVTTLNMTAKFLVTEPFVQWLRIFAEYFAVSLLVALAMLVAVVATRHRLRRAGPSQYLAACAAVVVAATLAIVLVAAWESNGTFGTEDPEWTLADYAVDLGSDIVRFALVGLLISSAWLYMRTETEHAASLEQVAIDSARMDEQTAEARLQVLEAQIEPHFLFNALANVRRLYETDPPSGARMLANLKAYLAIALPQMRTSTSTLGREVDHAVAYLGVQAIRMGRRLAYGLDVPDELRDMRMPPLMLVTLVENAIKHGIAPLPEGGRIDVRATRLGDTLRVDVTDTGQGFAKSGGAGTGLANTRARLAAQFGAAASLSLAINAPRGVVATLLLPCERVEGATAREARSA
jgi:signal transduction histidine kinase